ncbi:Rgg/GadR/MutR family transcriptional regulator [Enterococcus caccae]|uniref:Transcriptional activator, Rgg/GadR/MutR family domain-containing protein n=1 Tax=Enterococcus caccae ATCC BAA-1240 TaxID=1158612 RepID=R3UAY9_9ENTE|nr:Rgg/GadR/MutR family transcriptional regulator [Enterococcus caccae]EOL50568.1 transcriptional activator, Rgg/GadR/MutR family domain-containing protein [Enterococcus caccae ATCC BAA-1240]EOT59216.1 hypothetical protein I580_02248 [Enterococcus caccae ATCC BAA-1240]
MHSINTTFKKLRTERTISQADLVKNISNRSTLSSFEQKGSKISFDLLRRYLHRMNITLEEFEDLIHDEVQFEKKALSKKMLSLYYNNDFENLQTYCALCEEKYNKNKDFFYYHLYAQYIFILDTKEVISLSDSKKKDIQAHIYAYLNKIENWGKFEFSLFINLMYLFDDDYILLILKNIKKYAIAHQTITINYQLYSKFMINTFHLFAYRGCLEKIITELEFFSKVLNHDNLREKILCNYFKGIYLASTSDTTLGLQLIDSTITVFEQIGFKDYADELKYSKSIYLDRNKKP